MKKSYNPFKMWGSYLGGTIGGISLLFGGAVISAIFLAILGLCKGEFCADSSVTGLLTLFLPILFGFLIGWWIHSLVRRFTR